MPVIQLPNTMDDQVFEPGRSKLPVYSHNGGLVMSDVLDTLIGVSLGITSGAPNTAGAYVTVTAGLAGIFEGANLTTTTAVGGLVTYDVLISRNAGATWASLWPDATKRPTIAAGQREGSGMGDRTVTLNVGDRLVGGVAAGAASVQGVVVTRHPFA